MYWPIWCVAFTRPPHRHYFDTDILVHFGVILFFKTNFPSIQLYRDHFTFLYTFILVHLYVPLEVSFRRHFIFLYTDILIQI